MYLHNTNIYLTKDNGRFDDLKNLVLFDDLKFRCSYLSKDYKSSKGANSSVFKLTELNGEHDDCIIKIANHRILSRKEFRALGKWDKAKYKQKTNRFSNEMETLQKLTDLGVPNIVKFHFNGEVEIDGKEFPYYVMEKADTDLKEYLVSTEVDEQQKFEYCYEIFKGIKDLHSHDYYHRDIKPDNILLFKSNPDGNNFIWKLGDLGLIASRAGDYDFEGEKIGPVGWMSPEAINKWMTEKYPKFSFDCSIDNKSDFFQLGRLFFYIFMGTIPIGLLTEDDFDNSNDRVISIFELILKMLQQNKERRVDLTAVESSLGLIKAEYGI